MIFRALVVIRDNANARRVFFSLFLPLLSPLRSCREKASLPPTTLCSFVSANTEHRHTCFATAAVAIASIEPRASSEKDIMKSFFFSSLLLVFLSIKFASPTNLCSTAGLCCKHRDSECVAQKVFPNHTVDTSQLPCYCDHACLRLDDCCPDYKHFCSGNKFLFSLLETSFLQVCLEIK